MPDAQRVTVPTICMKLGVGRSIVERVLRQYSDRLPKPERAGVVRSWGPEIIPDVAAILGEESRYREARQ